MGEIGTVDDDEDIGPGLNHLVCGLSDQPQDLWQLLHHGGKTDDGEFLDWKERVQAFPRHGAAADAFEPYRIAEALAQHLHQAGTETVAQFLGRDQKDLPFGGCRRGRRRHAEMPSMKSPAWSAVSIMACGSTTSA